MVRETCLKIKFMKHIHSAFTVHCEKSEMASFASSRVKTIHPMSAHTTFPPQLICCIAFG